ncbi:hypothetical protein RJ639_029992, partial [Escallonia herrerae]
PHNFQWAKKPPLISASSGCTRHLLQHSQSSSNKGRLIITLECSHIDSPLFPTINMSSLSDLINLNLSESTHKIIAEYIWIGGSGMDLRSKARTLPGPVTDHSKLPKWNYDGSSTGQAPGEDNEVILYPQAIFKDPFRRGNNILVMSDAYTPGGEPIPTNKRHYAAKVFSHPDVVAEEPWYGIEQEYTLLQKDVKWSMGWSLGGFPGPQHSNWKCT